MKIIRTTKLLVPLAMSCLLLLIIAYLFGQTVHLIKNPTPQPPVSVTSRQEAVTQATVSTRSEDSLASVPAVTSVSTNPKQTTKHNSSILRSRDYPQLQYYALATPNDPALTGSWYHQKTQTNRAWDVTTGNTSTVIAVIDTGFALDHEDLSAKWQTNNNEQGDTSAGDVCWTGIAQDKATNDCDDDQNGYIDDWRGWDFAYVDNEPQTGEFNPEGDGVQHGTMVSGIIAASTNNSKGNAGVDWSAKIMPLQVLDDEGSGYTYDIVAAIEYAVDNGAKIINMSLGGSSFDQAMLDAVNYAVTNGVLVIAASGNCGASSTDECAFMTAPGRMAYPAKYAPVLSVGSTNSNDVRSSFSSYGPELDLVAPGGAVGPLPSWSSTITTDGYVASASGTSFAAPVVAGVAGLVRAQLGSPTVQQLTAALMDSSEKVSGMSGQYRTDQYGIGRINAHRATVLGKALASPATYGGTAAIQSRQPPIGAIARATSGNVGADEWVLVVCRVAAVDTCSTTFKGATTVSYTPLRNEKGASKYYTFVSGSSMPTGSSAVSVHSPSFATAVGTLTR